MIKPFSDQGYYTVFRNSILDFIMPECKPNTWKILCATLRQTVGWHREDHLMSVSFYMQATGIASRQTCHNAINDAVDKGYLIQKEVQTENGKSFRYAINRNFEMELPPTYTVTDSVTPTSTVSVTPPVTDSVHKNIKIKNNHKNKEDDNWKQVINAYVSLSGTISPFIAESLHDMATDWYKYSCDLPNSHPDKAVHPNDVLVLAIQEMGKHISRPNLKYLEKILHSWRESGINSKNKQTTNGKNKMDVCPGCGQASLDHTGSCMFATCDNYDGHMTRQQLP